MSQFLWLLAPRCKIAALRFECEMVDAFFRSQISATSKVDSTVLKPHVTQKPLALALVSWGQPFLQSNRNQGSCCCSCFRLCLAVKEFVLPQSG